MTAAGAGIPLQVDIVSDVVCPWCIIGYKQFEKALEQTDLSFDVSLRWHPFELNPQMPEEGQNLREHLAQKYGATAAQGQATRQRLTDLGESLGFRFAYSDDMRVVNTFRAHQLLHWADEQGVQSQLKLALFAAFFSERQNVNDIQVLCDTAAAVGLSGADAQRVLTEGTYQDAVRADEQQWLDREIHAVPAFVFNNRYSIVGAQDADTFIKVLSKLALPA